MKTEEHAVKYRKDYTPSPFLIETISLEFHLIPQQTHVKAISTIRRNPLAESGGDPSLVLAGERLLLHKVILDGKELAADAYQITPHNLTIPNVPENFTLEIHTEINPQANKALSGLYRSSGNFCTQCEPEGFRCITYFLDRPDVLARYQTRIIADKTAYPVLLSNGNLIDSGDCGAGEHYAVWEDPFPKPSYLFALVAGDLACVKDTYTTKSGKVIDLHIYVQHRNREKCDHAMRSLKKAMRWDEEVYGFEYDLQTYMIFAADDFNMGAMENKGLNIFNTKYVLASPESATDTDFTSIEGVIAHEYFHNWTGDRVTCRDWFQLSLKEGLTVFRDQEFSADMQSRVVKRINDVRLLRNNQFREDAGPMAHPVRPESFVEINNFYTVTIYEKGAEVIRMLRLLIGENDYYRGIRLYIKRFDGKAATCDDFVQAMEDASDRDLTQFKRWYSQAGTPIIEVDEKWEEGMLTLNLSQHCPPTPGQPEKLPFHIPVALGLLEIEEADGRKELLSEQRHLLEIKEETQTCQFGPFTRKPYISLLQGFSAPVKVERAQSRDELGVLMAHDTDLFNRWDAAQTYLTWVIFDTMKTLQTNQEVKLDITCCQALRAILTSDSDPAFIAQAITLPSENYLAQMMSVVDPELLGSAHALVKEKLAAELSDEFQAVYHRLNDGKIYSLESAAMARRSLRNICLSYLTAAPGTGKQPDISLAKEQFEHADNMTDSIAALTALSHVDCPERKDALDAFYRKWKDEALVVDKWFTIQASSSLPSVFDEVISLTGHPDFSLENPNRARSLIGAFTTGNHRRFHRVDGTTYTFLTDIIIKLNSFNPQIAARLLSPITGYKRYRKDLRDLMETQLQRIIGIEELSSDVYEIVRKSLDS